MLGRMIGKAIEFGLKYAHADNQFFRPPGSFVSSCTVVFQMLATCTPLQPVILISIKDTRQSRFDPAFPSLPIVRTIVLDPCLYYYTIMGIIMQKYVNFLIYVKLSYS